MAKNSPQRMCQHEHNGHMGRARMIEMCLNSIANSRTTTGVTKAVAAGLFSQIGILKESLAFRMNADGTEVQVGKGKNGQSKATSLK